LPVSNVDLPVSNYGSFTSCQVLARNLVYAVEGKGVVAEVSLPPK
jgi:hypothetical protein